MSYYKCKWACDIHTSPPTDCVRVYIDSTSWPIFNNIFRQTATRWT